MYVWSAHFGSGFRVRPLGPFALSAGGSAVVKVGVVIGITVGDRWPVSVGVAVGVGIALGTDVGVGDDLRVGIGELVAVGVAVAVSALLGINWGFIEVIKAALPSSVR